MNGKIKFFNVQKGFGFIIGEDKQDYFVHSTFLVNEDMVLEKDDAVTFTPSSNERGLQAKEVDFMS